MLRWLICLGALLVSAPAVAATVTIGGTSAYGTGNCIPFGGWHGYTTSPYMGFTYKNIPAFSLQAGDQIAFDLHGINDADIVMNIAFVAATSNGSDVPATSFTTVVSSGTPASPRGDTTVGNYELSYTATGAFSFAGGGLIVRFQPTGAFLTDTTCSSGVVGTDASDASGYFVNRWYNDADGVYSWTGSDTGSIGVMRITAYEETYYRDADGDGYGDSSVSVVRESAPSGYVTKAGDCNDGNSAIYPGRAEICDGIDQDCDGSIDEGLTTYTYYRDLDGDGYGKTSSGTTTTCATSAPSGYSSTSTDCNDADKLIYPGRAEICDGIDQDCDGSIDEGLTTYTYYRDLDGDGYGKSTSGTTTTCATTAPSGYSSTSTDCNDSNNAIYPGRAEICDGIDQDCDGTADDGLATTTYYRDLDGDGYGKSTSGTTATCATTAPSGYSTTSTDCNDSDSAVYPGRTEVCNSKDDDCDGLTDEGVGSTFYADSDGDTYGDATNSTVACTAPTAYVTDATDCDDARDYIYPGAPESCNGFDDDCDGTIDEGVKTKFYADSDGDTYGDAAATKNACSAPSGYVANATDCDDDDAGAYPGATETPYDGIDQDCSGADLTDVDGDGYDSDVVTDGDDCNDTDDSIHPGATETADGVDENCDGLVDEGTTAFDNDGDGYTADGGDCDDTDDTTYPGATEFCDGFDQDCDETVDEGTECYDDDGDGYDESQGDCDDGNVDRSPGVEEVLENGVDDDCDGIVDEGGINDPDEDGYSEAGGDCDNADGTVYPGAPELEDGKDNDCDDTIDEGTNAYDDDGDGYTENDGDCDDDDDAINPDGVETADGVDEDCDGVVDNGTDAYDDDGDGYTEDGGDCDDDDDAVHPGAEELPNGADDDCDGEADDGLDDLDGDGFGIGAGDCDDTNDLVYPNAYEICDGIDNDCNDAVDDNSVCEADEGGCNCSVGPTGAAGLLPFLLAGLVGIRRRRMGHSPLP